MRHGKAGFKLGRVTAHRWALFRNLLVALFRHERIMTTEAKAKAVRGLADQMVTLAKRDTLHARRQVLSMVPDPVVVKKLFDTIAARFGERHGGYTRIMHAGTRPGDRAPMVVLERLLQQPAQCSCSAATAATLDRGSRSLCELARRCPSVRSSTAR